MTSDGLTVQAAVAPPQKRAPQGKETVNNDFLLWDFVMPS